MMRKYMSKNIIFTCLAILTTINASHIFYLPLPKIHSSKNDLKPLSIVPKEEKQMHEQRSIIDNFLSLSELESNMYGVQDENRNLEIGGANSLTDEKPVARYHAVVEEYSSGLKDPNKPMLRSSYSTNSDADINAAMDRISQLSNSNAVTDPWIADALNSFAERLQMNSFVDNIEQQKRRNDTTFLVLVGVCCLIGILGLLSAAIFWYKIQKRAEAALDAEYPSYGVTGPSSAGKVTPGSTASDRKLAQSAQMFHYQQQRQQMMAQEKANLDAKPVHSDDSDEEAPDSKDYTVYECPGLAPTGEMEVRNPLFAEPDSSLTATAFGSHPTTNDHYPQPTATTGVSSSPPKDKSLS